MSFVESKEMINLPSSCNPYFCDGLHERLITSEKLQQPPSVYMKRMIAIHAVIVPLTFHSDFEAVIRSLSQRILDPKILAEENMAALDSFISQMKQLLEEELNLERAKKLMQHFCITMAAAGKIKVTHNLALLALLLLTMFVGSCAVFECYFRRNRCRGTRTEI